MSEPNYSPEYSYAWYNADRCGVEPGGRYLPADVFEQLDGGWYLSGDSARYASLREAFDDLKQAKIRAEHKGT